MADNHASRGGFSTNFRRDLAAYDAMPPELRRIVRELPNSVACEKIRIVAAEIGLKDDQIVQRVIFERQRLVDEHFARIERMIADGTDYWDPI